MKRIFPTLEQCPTCRRPLAEGETPQAFGAQSGQDFEWIEDPVFQFLLEFYAPLSDFGDWQWTPPATKTDEVTAPDGKPAAAAAPAAA